MKPVKLLRPLAIWLMRIAVLLYALLAYLEIFTTFNFQSVTFYLSGIFLLFTLLLFVGGFLKSSKVTVISSLVLILATGYHAFLNLQSGFDYNFGVYVVLGSIFVYFLANGNPRY